MIRRSSSRRGFSAPRRRKLIWGRQVDSTIKSVAPGTTSSLNPLTAIESDIGAQLFGATIMRIRASLFVYADAVTAAELESGFIAWGFIVREAPAATSLSPDFADIHADWMHWGARHLTFDSRDPVENEAGYQRIEIDVKSRRKLDEVGERLEFHLANRASSTFNVNWTLQTSVLVALS